MTMVTTGTRFIKASEFKAKCLALMDEVATTGEEIIITKNGVPVSKLVPYYERPDTLERLSSDVLEIRDDIVEPIDEPWNAE